ncbi:hypothetical protein LCGC14_3107370 [marine sediment metagenome]|uniref:Uncharacterized protein n=1 Tax=marine sediment metagenome TaxID=412755 RepID=A0A0F8W681_9ZZZZ
MKKMSNGLRNKIITAVITVLIASAIPSSIYLHNAWGDDRYVMKADDIRDQIRMIDYALFEADQDLSFAETEKEIAKYEARVKYYQREKEALAELLASVD